MLKLRFAGLYVLLAMAGLWSAGDVRSQDITKENVANSPLYFPNVDKNKDGYLSRSEVPKGLHDLRTHFDQYDQNHDHRLSAAEYSDYLTAMVAGACNSNLQSAKNPNCSGNPGVQGSLPGNNFGRPVIALPPPPQQSH
ncbi:MAG: EF-hand domain-containing protein [Rhodanobacter sp.]